MVDHLLALAASGTPLQVDEILVHSSRVPEGRITEDLQAAGYRARRDFSTGIWARNPNSLAEDCNPLSMAMTHPDKSRKRRWGSGRLGDPGATPIPLAVRHLPPRSGRKPFARTVRSQFEPTG